MVKTPCGINSARIALKRDPNNAVCIIRRGPWPVPGRIHSAWVKNHVTSYYSLCVNSANISELWTMTLAEI